MRTLLDLGRLIASAQADEGTPLDDPETLLRCARASLEQGVKVLRLGGLQNIEAIKRGTGAPVIGLIKKHYPDSEVYITPTRQEVDALLKTPCEVVALDGTLRRRPGDEKFSELVAVIRAAGRGVMADCDNLKSVEMAVSLGVDLVGTTLSGYTKESTSQAGPDLELVRSCRKILNASGSSTRLIAEGRYAERWQIEAALHAGADAVTVGSAINDPFRNTRKLMPGRPFERTVAAADVGGTWLRLGSQSGHGQPVVVHERIPLPRTRTERIDAIAAFLATGQFGRVGICTGGVVHGNVVTLSKKFIPENQGTDYNVLEKHLKGEGGPKVIALGDGHASAWAHACHPEYAGLDLCVLAIGTGLGFGHVRQGRIVMGREGLYSRLNDLPGHGGTSFERLLGGAALTPNPAANQMAMANEAVNHAVRMVSTFLFPDVVIVCGSVGMQPWLDLQVPPKEGWPAVRIERSPFGSDAGIQGAAAIALWPPQLD